MKNPSWKLIFGGRIMKVFQFPDFKTAWAFLNQVAEASEQRNHHPEIRNLYNIVELYLNTHDAGGLTALDFELAAEINRLAENYPS